MPLLHLLILALIQGITEFLPISSSGHLILLPGLTGMADQGQTIDVAVHVGTLLAVMLYFRNDMRDIFAAIPGLLRGRTDSPGARLTILLAISTIPVVLFGLFLKLSGFDAALRSVTVIGWAMLLFGILLYVADRSGDTGQAARDWSRADAIRMGLWQAIALIPGTSRSGITITAALFLGYERREAAKLSMLMSIPTIIAAGTLAGVEVAAHADAQAARDGVIAAVFAFAAALAALALMMRLLRSVSYTPYVIYRVILGIGLLVWAYSGA